ncbi:MAG: drug/metabolite transporter (DMT)-like permease [Planctomycetaceae bacterium]|jgi:drug/metabolite transporter (DMT)-like permease
MDVVFSPLAHECRRISVDDSKADSTMNDHRDFLAFAWYGNLGALLLGIGLLGVLIHRKSIRRWLSAFVGLLGILFLCEGGALFHGAMLSLRGSIVGALLTVVASVALVRSLKLTGAATRKSP